MAVNVGRIDPKPMHPLGGFAKGFNKIYQENIGPKILQQMKDRRQDEKDMADFRSMVTYETKEAEANLIKANQANDAEAKKTAFNKLIELRKIGSNQNVTPSMARTYVREIRTGRDSDNRIKEGKIMSADKLANTLTAQGNTNADTIIAADIKADFDTRQLNKDIASREKISEERSAALIQIAGLRKRAADELTAGNKISQARLDNTIANQTRTQQLKAAEAIAILKKTAFGANGRTLWPGDAKKFVAKANEMYRLRGLLDRVELHVVDVPGPDAYTYKYIAGDKKGIVGFEKKGKEKEKKSTKPKSTSNVIEDTEETKMIGGVAFSRVDL